MKKFFSRLKISFDHSFSHSVLSQFKWLGCVVLIAFIFLMIMSLFLYNSGMNDDGSRGLIVDTIMLLFDPGCMTDRMSNAYVILTALCGIIIFMGMFIPIVSNVLERRTDAVLNGAVSYDLEDHHIILGYNKSIPSLINFIRRKMNDDSYILLMSDQPTEEVRANILVSLGHNIEKKIIILNGRRNAKEDLDRLSIENAKSLWIIGEEDEEGHDSINFECAAMVADIRENTTPLDCHIMFTQPSIYSCFQYSDITEEMKKFLNFLPFNPYENWAKKVLVAGPEKKEFFPLDTFSGIAKDSEKHVHLIVIGMSRMGQALAVEAAHTAHFPNFKEDDMSTRTHITFIDSNAEEEMYKFKTRFSGMFELAASRYVDTTEEGWESTGWDDPMHDPALENKHLGNNFIDVKWEFINGMADSPAVHNYIADAVSDIDSITTIAVCLPKAEESLRISLSLPYQAYDCQQILVYQEVYSALLNNLSEGKKQSNSNKKDNIRQFGAMSDYYDENKIGEEEGKWINFFYNDKADGDADYYWKKAKVVDQWSSIHSANILYTKLRCIGLTVDADINLIKKALEDNMDDLMDLEHNRWNVDKLLSGFRVLTDQEYADFKACEDKSKKDKKNELKNDFAHLDICSYEQLHYDDPGSIQSDADVTMALVEIIKGKADKK